ncbi:EpsG family protein [Lederbergia panacisoli]|uniref:EpsG family protein n=1 Tax=Lederbergia panacisoli TaxID=1255251 RepID=UPI00214AB106|nr:EpsG family protein [Lederbergia panacisoli]MCR2822037.1 EpsG family protein [Lederbergia panacisoli]
MTFLYLNLAIVFILSFFARYFSAPVLAGESSVPIKPNKILMTGVLASLTIISGLRANIGDTFFYKHIYEINDFTWEFILSQKDIGFGILQMLLKKISDDPQIMIFTTAVITNALIIAVFLKYSRMIELSVYVYITGGLFLVSMNGIRQVLAAAIIFTATKYLIDGNWIKYFFIVILASTFHQSAFILIPIYFFVRYKAWSKATLVLLGFSLLIVVGYQQFSQLLFAAIEDSQYGHYSNFDEGGANILRVVVDAIPLLIAYLGREKLRKIFPSSDYIVNMALVGFMFMIISTQNWIFARFGIYFTLYQLILISWIVKLFSEKDQRFIYYALLICYFLYYFYESVLSLSIVYRSDYFGG